MKLQIYNTGQRKERYEMALEQLLTGIEAEQQLKLVSPTRLSVIRVLPVHKPNPAMRSDDAIELIGMETAIRFEQEQGREPKDVSAENLGFDIRSIASDGTRRYIEVKARAKYGPVSLTRNEWFKAIRFGEEYYLYVVVNASEAPELHIVRNPAENLAPDLQVVRYIVSLDQIQEKGTIQ